MGKEQRACRVRGEVQWQRSPPTKELPAVKRLWVTWLWWRRRFEAFASK
jgi:hypothetical protein